MKLLRYSDFVDLIDVDQVYDALNWAPERSTETEDIGYCPDWAGRHKHGDTTGKFAFNHQKKVYNCWVCGGGSLLSLVMEMKEMTFQEATDWLYQFTKSRKLSPNEFYAEIDAILDTGKPDEKPLPFFNDRVLERFQKNGDGRPWYNWIASRHISVEVAEFFKVGYSSNHVKPGKDGSYEGEVIILPHFFNEKLVGWQERWLGEDRPKWVGKYTNTHDFPREDTLWGYDFCRKQKEQPIIVESVPSALFLISEGYPAMATFGGNVAEGQIKVLRQFTQGVILGPDNDAAGIQWIKGERSLVTKLERYVPVLATPFVEAVGGDLGDLTPDELGVHLRGVDFVF